MNFIMNFTFTHWEKDCLNNLIFIYLYMLIFINTLLSLLIPTKVYINLEKPNPLITHAGITFKNNNECIRYDFRAFNNDDNYLTTEESRENITLMFPLISNKLITMKGYNEYRNNILLYSKEIFLGETNYSLKEIMEYENTLNKFYILGIHDCRHYVNDLTKWTLNMTIPIWNLETLE